MSLILEYFKEITKIPHCSQDSDRLLDFILSFAKSRDYDVKVDNSKNIYIYKENPILALQGHYDMVCIGDAPNIEVIEENGWLKAKNSSLGADNGIAIAFMMELMDRRENLEFILTSDEEIGLIGANALEFNLKSKYMLNLDSEEEGEVCIGCAGGVDIVAFKEFELKEANEDIYTISISGLKGGHSGVDIDKNIPSAIKVLGDYLFENNLSKIISFNGGERRNSIPTSAKAIVYSQKALKSNENIKIKLVEEKKNYLEVDLVKFIKEFKQGVRSFNSKLNIPQTSINLAIIKTDKNRITVEITPRSMNNSDLENISNETKEFLESFGFDVKLEYKYPAWSPDKNSFTKIVEKSLKEIFNNSKATAIHAGLECGVILQKYPNMLFASIGPTIKYPHSKDEKIDINSIDKTFKVIENIIKEVKNERV